MWYNRVTSRLVGRGDTFIHAEYLYDAKVKDIYIRAIRDTFGDVPCSVINDGDVSALAGASLPEIKK